MQHVHPSNWLPSRRDIAGCQHARRGGAKRPRQHNPHISSVIKDWCSRVLNEGQWLQAVLGRRSMARLGVGDGRAVDVEFIERDCVDVWFGGRHLGILLGSPLRSLRRI